MGDKRINVIGAGAWGTALGVIATKVASQVCIWSYEKRVTDQINETHHNDPYLKAVLLPKTLTATSDMSKAVDADILLLVSPAQVTRSVCVQMQQAGLRKETILVICSKGIENDTSKLLSEVVRDVLPKQEHIAVLSGPNFAKEVARGKLAACSLACEDESVRAMLVQTLGMPEFRTYASDDIIGAQICGALKNILAIACGIAKGKGFGENVIAMLITRGVGEIARLVEAKGGRRTTVMGMCGIGDIILTCTSLTSRNMSFGHALGKTGDVKQTLAAQSGTIEGYYSTKSVYALAQSLQIEMPICEALYKVLYEEEDMDEMIHHLLAKPLSMDVQDV